ncbi:TNT domain-containing protein, partial [Paenibacillus helianthi]|uniref:TNT domain-containing protein n=1 Tax=Paenibacillus helianthi TaxID=1349432 RepID=UPI000A9DC232
NPEVMKRLKETYWSTLSTEEQDRIYAETKAYYEKQEKEVADKNRLLRSGVGNQTLANILEGGSNILVNAIDTASYGMAGTITDWTMGPKPAGYVDPTDNPYGKNAGQLAGNLISIGLPLKYLNSVKTSGAVGNFSPTLMKSVVAGAISGTVGEAMDAFNDFRDDGKQSLGERIAAVGINTVIAGAGDLMITAGSKVAASTMRFVRGKLPDIKLEKVEVAGKPEAEIEIKPKEVEEPHIERTGKVISDADRLKLGKWRYRPSDELYINYKEVFDNPKYYDQLTGDIKWPKNDGFDGVPNKATLKIGTRIDRYGFESGSFVSPEYISYEMRSLAPGTNSKPYHVYEVMKEIDALEGTIAPWFDETGEGIQFKLYTTIQDLIDEGYLKEVFN